MEDCSDYRIQLELLPSLQTADPQFIPLIGHLKNCGNCMKHYHLSQILDEHIKQSFSNIDFPPLLKEKITAQCDRLNNIHRNRLSDENELSTPDSLIQKLKWLATHSIQQHIDLIEGIQSPQPEKQQFPKSSVMENTISKNSAAFFQQDHDSQPLHKCQLGNIQADFIFFEEEGRDASLYLVPDEKAELTRWNGKKKTIQQGNYSVSIWKTGVTVYSKVLKSNPGRL